MNEQLKKKYEEYIKLRSRQQQTSQQPNNQPTTKKPKQWKIIRDGIKDGMYDNTLYVTSFNEPMYNMSGKYLMETWSKFNPNQYLLVCYEDMILNDNYKEIIPYNLTESKFLRSWLTTNEKDIPVEYGGKATPKNNPDVYNNYFNKAASKWFRKIVSIDYAIKQFGHLFNHVVWIDADCYITNPMSHKLSNDTFGSNHIIYHLSSKRRKNKQGIESGIIGFKKGLGYLFMDIVSNKFKTGEFKKYPRWDDGWVFREVVNEQTELNKKRTKRDIIHMKDLVGHIDDSKIIRSEVIPYGPYNNYVIHDKGKHNNLRGHKVKKKNHNKG